MPSRFFLKKRFFLAIGVGLLVLVLAFLIFGGLKGGNKLSYAERIVLALFGPVSQKASLLGYGCKRIWHYYLWLHGVAEENERLRSEIARLQAELVQAREHELEYERLSRLLKIAQEFQGLKVVARIVARPLGGWQGLIVIDKGKDEGIFPEMPVVAATPGGTGALVGQVVAVTKHYAKVLLITDPSSAVDVLVQRTRQRGLVRGAGGNQCLLDYVPAEADVREKDIIVTSGLDGIYPKGVLVGRVSKVLPGREKGLFQLLEVAPAAPLQDLEEVLVLLKKPVP